MGDYSGWRRAKLDEGKIELWVHAGTKGRKAAELPSSDRSKVKWWNPNWDLCWSGRLKEHWMCASAEEQQKHCSPFVHFLCAVKSNAHKHPLFFVPSSPNRPKTLFVAMPWWGGPLVAVYLYRKRIIRRAQMWNANAATAATPHCAPSASPHEYMHEHPFHLPQHPLTHLVLASKVTSNHKQLFKIKIIN